MKLTVNRLEVINWSKRPVATYGQDQGRILTTQLKSRTQDEKMFVVDIVLQDDNQTCKIFIRNEDD